VEGSKLIDACGRHVQLFGVSHFWHTWEGSEHWNQDVAAWLRDDWRVSLLRAPLAAHPNVEGDYLLAPDSSMAQLRQLVEGAIAEGMYIVVDFHAHKRYTQEAIEVLGTIARDYGDTPNLLYAIWNEPEGSQEPGGPEAMWKVIKEHAAAVIPEIRKHDPNNIIVVPTPHYDQYPEVVVDDPLTEENLGIAPNDIMYDVHFYAGQHKENVRGRTRRALNAGVPIIITEVGRTAVNWGPENTIDSASFETWMDFVDSNKVSFTKWSLSYRVEKSSSLLPTAAAQGGWIESDLTNEGKFNRAFFRRRGEAFYAQEACE